MHVMYRRLGSAKRVTLINRSGHQVEGSGLIGSAVARLAGSAPFPFFLGDGFEASNFTGNRTLKAQKQRIC